MKKVLCVLSILVIVSLSICIPVFASSFPVTYDPPHLNSNPTVLCFSNRNDPTAFVVPSSVWEDYIYVDNLSDTWLSIYVQCLDVNLNIVYPSLYYIDVYREGVLYHTFTVDQTSVVYSIDYSDYLDTGRYDKTIVFRCPDASVSVMAILPVPISDPDYIQDYIDTFPTVMNEQYYSLIGYGPGYTDGYTVGFEDGAASNYEGALDHYKQIGYELGYGDGYYDGYHRADPSDDFHAISDATINVVSSPFRAISNFLNFNVFGVNLASLFGVLLTLLVIGFIIKKLI